MTPEQYTKLARHIFNYPDRKMCLQEWKRIYLGAPSYDEGITKIHEFFNIVLKTETKRLEDKSQPTFPKY